MSIAPPPIAPIEHPRGGRLIRRGKAWGGIGGFAFAAAASYLHGAVLFDTLARGLAGGAFRYVLGWGAGVFAARHIVLAEARSAAERALERRRRRAAGNG